MDYDCTKSLGARIYDYLKSDLKQICDELETKGIVCEGQFRKLYSMVFKKSSSELIELLRERTGLLNLIITYSDVYNMFCVYNVDVYTHNEAIVELERYCKKNYPF